MTDDQGEVLSNYIQRIGYLERRVEQMTVLRDDAGMDRAALRVAELVEDEFARHHKGGRVQRLAKCQVIVREAMREMLIGERAWNAWSPTSLTVAPEEPA